MSTGQPAAPQPPAAAPTPDQNIIVSGGIASLVLAGVKILATLTTERALILYICIASGYMFYTRDRQQLEDKAQERRQFEESKERDRQHCDTRDEKNKAWYTQLVDSQRKFESEQRTADRTALADLTKTLIEQREKDRAALAELTKVIARKFPDSP